MINKQTVDIAELFYKHSLPINKQTLDIAELFYKHSLPINKQTLDIAELFYKHSLPINKQTLDIAELFYKHSLPIKIRNYLSFDESIELNFGRKKFFFTLIYRSSAFSHTSPEFKVFLSNFTNLYSKIKNENPNVSFFTGEGLEIENLIRSLNLSQLIPGPTNFEPNKNTTCIDLLITDHPNLALDCGTRASLDSFCHHEIT